jgi:hypothetical protein
VTRVLVPVVDLFDRGRGLVDDAVARVEDFAREILRPGMADIDLVDLSQVDGHSVPTDQPEHAQQDLVGAGSVVRIAQHDLG